MARPESDPWCGRHARRDDSCPQCTIALSRKQRHILKALYWKNPEVIGKVNGHTVRSMKALVKKGLLREDADGFHITEFGRTVAGRGRG